MASIEKFRGSWRVRWRVDGRSKSKTFPTKGHASNFKAKIEHEIAQGTYLDLRPESWEELRKQFEDDVVTLKKATTKSSYRTVLNQFEEIAKPSRATDLTTELVDKYIARRTKMHGKKKGSTVSPATINRELRVLRRLANKAHQWKYLREAVIFNKVKEPQTQKRFMTEEHFGEIYAACKHAFYPAGLPYEASAWWQGLLTFIYFTGWRISEPTSLRRKDVKLDQGIAITRHTHNKGGRDEFVRLHPIVIDHLESLQSFHAEMFPWPMRHRTLYKHWHMIQDKAGIELECIDSTEHVCNSECWHYGFHDIRRAFATTTGAELTQSELQAVMRHRSYQTTQRYINDRERMRGFSTDKMKVPASLQEKRG